jgi:alpha-methylacyl-CoA racemase
VPVPPLNLLGEYAGGAMFLALGLVSAILAAQATGRGQVVEASIVEGSAALMTLYYTLHGGSRWADTRASNLIDGGAPFYRCYACADSRHVAVGALETQSYAALCEGLGIGADAFAQYDRARWIEMGEAFAEAFASRSRDDWIELFEGRDACVTPVLSLSEAPHHPHNLARGTFAATNGVMMPRAVPRFSETPGAAVAQETSSAEEVLERWG